jgi:formylglycine-generating enzyme required for sulfatase activity
MRYSTCVCFALGALAATVLSCASTQPANAPNTRLAKLGIPVPRLVHIPAGSFTMGDDAGSPAERPAHRRSADR